MNISEIQIIKNEVWATVPGLISLGATPFAAKQWRNRRNEGVGEWKEINGKHFMQLNSVPNGKVKRGMLKESQVFRELQRQVELQKMKDALNYAKLVGFTAYQSQFENIGLKPAYIPKAAKIAAQIDCFLKMQDEGSHALQLMHEAINTTEPGKYSAKQRFCQVLKDARNEGLQVCVDKRWYGNNKRENKPETLLFDYLMAALTASPKMLTAREMMIAGNAFFTENGMRTYGPSTYKQWRKKWLKNIEVLLSRNGKMEADKKMPYNTYKRPSHTNMIWEIDGLVLPFWGKGEKGFKSYNLVIVIDATSKKIVGYAFGESENTTVIMEALRDAVSKTGVLPFELVSDGHSATRTLELQNVKALFDKKGSTWRVTHFGQDKSTVERAIPYLNAIWKHCYGFNGIGIKAKSIDAQPKDELKTEYGKNLLNLDTIKGYAVYGVETYNSMPMENGKTPDELHAEKLHPQPIHATEPDRAQLLMMQAEKKIIRGQITIQRGAKYEFPIPARFFQQYNDETVIVRYDALQDGIWIFDKTTDEAITFLHPKDCIHKATSEQSDEDVEAFNKQAGRKNGIVTQARKQLEDLTAKVEQIHPDTYAKVSALSTSKDLIKELRENGALRFAAIDNGVDIEAVHIPGNINDSLTPALKPKQKRRDTPFTPVNNQIEIINPLTQFDNL